MDLQGICSAAALALAVSAAGCVTGETWTSEPLDEVLGACAVSGEQAPGASPSVTDPLEIRVALGPDCYSSSCSRLDEESCEARVEGNRIIVEASAVVGVKTQGADDPPGTVSCTDDCSTFTIPCVIDSLPAGTYEVVEAGAADDADPLHTFEWPWSPDDAPACEYY
ncbi:MAG: hypothetical protein ACE37F_03805 [Nannocystaceae bacterium]|nr:hypothetical protein [bacterium]